MKMAGAASLCVRFHVKVGTSAAAKKGFAVFPPKP